MLYDNSTLKMAKVLEFTVQTTVKIEVQTLRIRFLILLLLQHIRSNGKDDAQGV